MIHYDDLTQLVAFYKYGTLTKVAEEFLISQPTLTRNMRRLEDTLGVSLFIRSANRLTFNETGIQAAHYAEELLTQTNRFVSNVQDFDRKQRTITVSSCAPAPLWNLIPTLSKNDPDKTISSTLEEDVDKIENAIINDNCTLAILPYYFEHEGIDCKPYIEEHLSICVKTDHALAKYTGVTTEIINGHNCLLSSEIGFWNTFCKKTMPSSRFLVQTDEFAFRELIQESTLPFFTTNLSSDSIPEDRINIPIMDDAANITYYVCRKR